MCIVDNLLVIHNHSDVISMIYDIKRYHIYFPIGCPSPMPVLKEKDTLQKKKTLLMKPSNSHTFMAGQSINYDGEENTSTHRRSIYFPSGMKDQQMTSSMNSNGSFSNDQRQFSQSLLTTESTGSIREESPDGSKKYS
jgi:hypothetical protein